MERISVFDMLKIGVGPSSSHTLGPWLAARRWLEDLKSTGDFDNIEKIKIYLYGSLALTGKGHYTDKAILLGLLGENPRTIDTSSINEKINSIKKNDSIKLLHEKDIVFSVSDDLCFLYGKKLPYHANGMKFSCWIKGNEESQIYYSIGGGFIEKEGESIAEQFQVTLPFPCDQSEDLLNHCKKHKISVSEMVFENEKAWRTEEEIKSGLIGIWHIMEECVYKGCTTSGILPGGLGVTRRAAVHNQKLMKGISYTNSKEWIAAIKGKSFDFQEVLEWISCFAMAVNEENAAMGRVVTAPTNGASGVIPAVLMYYFCFQNPNVTDEDIVRFLMVAGEIGSFFKKGATISAAMGGCQAEIGVSSAMAAAALTEIQGGTPAQVLMAAEIAMEHHLGLTCDPIGGLVQIPCIERNSMGAVKAITASKIAIDSDPALAKIPLDKVIKTMWDTAKDMNVKYKETSEGGLAANISVNVPEC